MKDYFPELSQITAFAGIAGGAFSAAIGGVDGVAKALVICMAIDWILGTADSLIFKSSPKTETGGYNSSVGFKGLFKKCVILVMVVVANILDSTLETTFFRDGVAIAYLANEVASIIENVGVMGIPVPAPLSAALDILKQRGDKTNGGQ